MEPDLNLAEIPYPDGDAIQFRYMRYLGPNGDRWIRHGLFRVYHKSARLATEGNFLHGNEEGVWRDYHENGQLAAEGSYEAGRKIGTWRYWSDDGRLEQTEDMG